MSDSDISETRSPAKSMEPLVGSIRRRTRRPTVVLPEPLSPTRPSASPRPTSKLTPFTACTLRCREPRTGKYLTRSRTASNGSAAGSSVAGVAAAGALSPAADVITRASRSRLYSSFGRSKNPTTGVCSTRDPLRMTATSSQYWATMPRSRVTIIVADPRSASSRRKRLSTCRCTVTSRPAVGSSAMITSGECSSAMAISTRWAMPTLSSWGWASLRRSGSGIPTEASASVARAAASGAVTFAWATIARPSWSPIVVSGSSEAPGLEPMRAIFLPRTRRRERSSSESRSSPSRSTSPSTTRPGKRTWLTSECTSTDLPHPVSPTRPSIWPLCRSMDTSLTASTSPAWVKKVVETPPADRTTPLPPLIVAPAG